MYDGWIINKQILDETFTVNLESPINILKFFINK